MFSLDFHHVLGRDFSEGLTKSVGTGIEDDILIELLSMVGVRLIEGVIDLKAFRSIGTVRRELGWGSRAR